MKNKKCMQRRLDAQAESLLRAANIWQAVQGQPLSYKEKQELADTVRKRQQLARLKRRLRSNQVDNRTSAILGATAVDGHGGFCPPVKKWDDSYVRY